MSGIPLSSHFLKPGELHVSRDEAVVSTVLGSCISVTLFVPRLRMGGICHALLPQGAGDFKYVNCAVDHLLASLCRLGARSSEIEAKLFGGADMFDSSQARSSTVGRQNVLAAREILLREKLHLKAQDTGGIQGRKILFLTHTGEVYLKKLGR